MHKIKIFLIAGIIAILGTNAFATCTIYYSCGETGEQLFYNTTTSATLIDASQVPCTKEGYVFTHWSASEQKSKKKTFGGYTTTTTTYDSLMPGYTYSPGCNTSNTNYTTVFTANWTEAAIFATPTSKKYVDDEMAKLQPKFAGLGNNKLMTYSSTTDGALGSRDIVTTLGDSTTANSIPTRGAINTALNTKQDTVNGTAGWVMENTGTAGRVKAKPVYSTTDNYKTALVEAGDLNQIVVDAVNSELIPVEGVGWRINTAENLTLPTLRVLLPNVSINGNGSNCYRKLNGGSDQNSSCSAATLSTLGASGNKSGLWGVVMSYGDIVGKSVCSATAGTENTAATAAQESSLAIEFNNQTGVGESALSSEQMNCWCKMESVDNEPAVSSWVFMYTYDDSAACANSCVVGCANHVQAFTNFRTPMFNSVQ